VAEYIKSVDPQTARKLCDAAVAEGVKFLECPLGKTPAQAETAEEPIFVGGDKKVYEELKPVLEIVGSPVYYMGEKATLEYLRVASEAGYGKEDCNAVYKMIK
jgi:3-hydroxyisobutyrate dehydrogenase-like beta-hydroxyacid dehydrogenase